MKMDPSCMYVLSLSILLSTVYCYSAKGYNKYDKHVHGGAIGGHLHKMPLWPQHNIYHGSKYGFPQQYYNDFKGYGNYGLTKYGGIHGNKHYPQLPTYLSWDVNRFPGSHNYGTIGYGHNYPGYVNNYYRKAGQLNLGYRNSFYPVQQYHFPYSSVWDGDVFDKDFGHGFSIYGNGGYYGASVIQTYDPFRIHSFYPSSYDSGDYFGRFGGSPSYLGNWIEDGIWNDGKVLPLHSF